MSPILKTGSSIPPGVLCGSKPEPTATEPRRLPGAPRPSGAELCQTPPTHEENATGAMPE